MYHRYMPRTLPDHEVFTNARTVLQDLIHAAGVRREEVAKAMRMSPSTLNDRLCDRSHLTLADVHRAAEFFDVDPQVFFRASERVPRGSPAGEEETSKAA